MATFIDEDENTSQATEDDQFDTLDSETADSIEEQPEVSEEEDDIPEKYRGKSVKDIVRMHQEAEKAMGKQGSEVGELRRLVDDYIRAQTISQQAPKVEEEEIDFFENPDAAIQKAIEKHPKVRQAEELAVPNETCRSLK
jgi:bacterioferritin (cytochrome b1)